MLIVLLVILLVSLWGLWNLYVQTLRFNDLLGSCEQTLQQLQDNVAPHDDGGETAHDP